MAFDGSTIGSATSLAFVAGVISDSFSAGNNDVDMIRVEFEAGRKYAVDIDNANSGDFFLRIFDANGTEVMSNDDGLRAADDTVFTLSPYVEFVPNFSGTYYVAVSPYYLDRYNPFTTVGRVTPENPLPITNGQLTITDLGIRLFPAALSIASITSESVNDLSDSLRDEDRSIRLELTGAIDNATDIDIARLDLAKGDIIVVDVNGEAGTVLRIFEDTGAQIGIDDDAGAGEDPELIFVTPVADDYYIGISGDGNAAYSSVDGSGAVVGAIGSFEIIIHRNPTLIGTSLVNVISGTLSGDYIVSLGGGDSVSGLDGNDILAGGDEADTVNGGRGNDTLYGEQGDDELFGAAGIDILAGGLGNDRLRGGNDADILEGNAGDDHLDGDTGDDTLDGGGGADRLLGDIGNDVLRGGTGIDVLFGNDGDDTLSGGADADTLAGAVGSDILNGDAGDDILNGGVGEDTLAGGTGNDNLTGGSADDDFVFVSVAEGVDTITDFLLPSGDVIDLTGLFGAGVVNAGNLAQFVQTSNAGVADSFLAVDADGLTGGLNFTIIAQVNGVTAAELFDAANFVL